MDKPEIIYGYTRRKKQNCPTTTVAVITDIREGELFFGIGIAKCADHDFPVKAYGRCLAGARASGALSRSGDIYSKMGEDNLVTQLLGMCVSWEDAHVAIQDFELDLTVTTRIGKTLT